MRDFFNFVGAIALATFALGGAGVAGFSAKDIRAYEGEPLQNIVGAE
jgi:hypothetical protein